MSIIFVQFHQNKKIAWMLDEDILYFFSVAFKIVFGMCQENKQVNGVMGKFFLGIPSSIR